MRDKYEESFMRSARNDSIINMAMHQGRILGESREETMARVIVALLQLKDEVFQQRVDEMLSSTTPLMFKEFTPVRGLDDEA